MTIMEITAPINLRETSQCTLTSPWFVQNTEYPPTLAGYKPLVNGEEAFAAVYHAIASARQSVDIICWGFQPSMYFIRDGKSPCIGELLVNIAEQKGIQVRILGWEMPLNSAGFAGEANLPGKGALRLWDRAGQSASREQYRYDKQWFSAHAWRGEWKDLLTGTLGIPGQIILKNRRDGKLRHASPLFVERGFDTRERAEIAWRAALLATDNDISPQTVGTLAATATHHQKTVLVDYALPEHAVGFVMGHNMLDEYWDTDAHSAMRRAGKPDACPPNSGASGFLPRQDISAQVTGPILEHLHENFATAWYRETRQDLLTIRNAKAVAKQLVPRSDAGTPLMAQLLRTQTQDDIRDIEKLCLNAVNNATQFIYIENQYFRWPPLAEAIKKAALDQTRAGRDPGQHGALHLFVVTNSTDDGIGSGTVNTQRMLESLGRADTIPLVTKEMQIRRLDNPVEQSIMALSYPGSPAAQEQSQKMAAYLRQVKEIRESTILPEERPGLKVHICSLVAPDSPPHNWMPVYVHSKLMIVNDVFTTHGSANINTRSMQVDSEMNIAHEWASVTRDLRRRLWHLHTSGKGVQDNAAIAFKKWADLMSRNRDNQKNGLAPEASLVPFLYNKPVLKDLD